MRKLLLPALLLVALSPLTSYAQEPRPSDSPATEVQRLQKALGQALDKIEHQNLQLKAADEAIVALKEERNAAVAVMEAARAERESLQRTIDLNEKLGETYKKTIESLERLNDRYEKRTASLEDKLDKANSRTLKTGVAGFILGVLTKVF